MALPINVGDTVNVRLCISQTPIQATVTSVDNIRGLVGVTYLSGELVPFPSVVALSCCRELTDAQFAVPVGGANGVWT